MSAAPDRYADRVTAVVINYNRETALTKALRAMRSQTIRFAELLVVDSASTDNSIELARADGDFELIRLEKNLGPAATRNAALKAATTDFVFIIDADVQPSPACCAALLASLEAKRAAMAIPRIAIAPELETQQFDSARPHFLGLLTLENQQVPLEAMPSEDRVVRAAAGACMLLRKADALEVGGFCELFFFYFEDLEFSQRIVMSGREIVLSATAVVGHDPGKGTEGLSFRVGGDYPKQRAFLTMRNRWLTIVTLFSARSIVVLSPALLVFELAAIAGCVARGWLPQWAAAWSWILTNHRAWRPHRAMAQSIRKRRDSEVLSGGDIPFATGFFKRRWQTQLASALSWLLNAYWRLVRRLL